MTAKENMQELELLIMSLYNTERAHIKADRTDTHLIICVNHGAGVIYEIKELIQHLGYAYRSDTHLATRQMRQDPKRAAYITTITITV